jgi:hypothetical protein
MPHASFFFCFSPALFSSSRACAGGKGHEGLRELTLGRLARDASRQHLFCCATAWSRLFPFSPLSTILSGHHPAQHLFRGLPVDDGW